MINDRDRDNVYYTEKLELLSTILGYIETHMQNNVYLIVFIKLF